MLRFGLGRVLEVCRADLHSSFRAQPDPAPSSCRGVGPWLALRSLSQRGRPGRLQTLLWPAFPALPPVLRGGERAEGEVPAAGDPPGDGCVRGECHPQSILGAAAGPLGPFPGGGCGVAGAVQGRRRGAPPTACQEPPWLWGGRCCLCSHTGGEAQLPASAAGGRAAAGPALSWRPRATTHPSVAADKQGQGRGAAPGPSPPLPSPGKAPGWVSLCPCRDTAGAGGRASRAQTGGCSFSRAELAAGRQHPGAPGGPGTGRRAWQRFPEAAPLGVGRCPRAGFSPSPNGWGGAQLPKGPPKSRHTKRRCSPAGS